MSRAIDLEEIRRRALRRIHWDGGNALPESVEPEDIVWLVDRVRALSALVPYADHQAGCRQTGTNCSCGLDQARREAQV